MADVLKKVPVREQDAKVRATNFEEVCLGYNMEEAMEEASRCLNCKNAKCIQGCPVSIDIPAFIQEVKEGNIEEAICADHEHHLFGTCPGPYRDWRGSLPADCIPHIRI